MVNQKEWDCKDDPKQKYDDLKLDFGIQLSIVYFTKWLNTEISKFWPARNPEYKKTD